MVTPHLLDLLHLVRNWGCSVIWRRSSDSSTKEFYTVFMHLQVWILLHLLLRLGWWWSWLHLTIRMGVVNIWSSLEMNVLGSWSSLRLVNVLSIARILMQRLGWLNVLGVWEWARISTRLACRWGWRHDQIALLTVRKSSWSAFCIHNFTCRCPTCVISAILIFWSHVTSIIFPT